MPPSRREFLIQASLASLSQVSRAAPALLSADRSGNRGAMATARVTAPPLIRPDNLEPFVDPLPILPTATPVASPGAHGKPGAATLYRLEMTAISAKVHRDVPPTTFWGYGNGFPGPTIEARQGQPICVEWANHLPERHFLPIDYKLCGAERNHPEVRTVVHLHGGRVPAESDGYPESWYGPGKAASYSYPNGQDAAMLWYHDHAMGIERLNVYAGLFGAYLIRDSNEDGLNLPRGKYEVPLLLCDRMLRRDGQLYYPISLNPEGPWVPEVFGDCFLVNGKLLPYLEVEPRKYRFRILNASNARFFRLTLENGQSFHQIGTDQGFLSAPVEVKRLQLAGGERSDVIVDFSQSAGEQVVLRNDILPLLQFRVEKVRVTDTISLPRTLKRFAVIQEKEAVVTRTLTLNEYDNVIGKPMSMLLNGSRWEAPVTETPRHGSVEIWQLVNLTPDTHPIHLHQVRFQVLDRQPILVPAYLSSKTLSFRGPATPPAANEAGWKDTVRVEARGVTRIIVRFDGYAGRFVWHCHTLEHAANEMMRPYEIVPA
jgi:spore coat protein A, manganese oxidase